MTFAISAACDGPKSEESMRTEVFGCGLDGGFI